MTITLLPNIYRIDDTETFVAAATLDEAIAWYVDISGPGLGGAPTTVDLDQCWQVSEADLDQLLFSDDNNSTYTFREQLRRNCDEGWVAPYLFGVSADAA